MSDNSIKIAQAPVEDHSDRGVVIPQNAQKHDCEPKTLGDAAKDTINKDLKEHDKGLAGTAQNAAVGVLDMGLSFFGMPAGLLSNANNARQAITVGAGTMKRMEECKGDEHGALTSPRFPVTAKAEPTTTKKVVAL